MFSLRILKQSTAVLALAFLSFQGTAFADSLKLQVQGRVFSRRTPVNPRLPQQAVTLNSSRPVVVRSSSMEMTVSLLDFSGGIATCSISVRRMLKGQITEILSTQLELNLNEKTHFLSGETLNGESVELFLKPEPVNTRETLPRKTKA